MVPCDCFGDLVEEKLHTTSLNEEDFNSGNENSNSDTEDSVTETIKDSVTESQKSDWIESVASLSCISSLMYGCQEMVNDARTSDIPDVEQWIVDAQDTIKQVQESCGRFLKNTDSLLHQIQTKKPKVNDASSSQVSVVHDPGLRGEVRGENQKEYPIEHGPFQPKLSCFPANQDIPQGKQNRFSPRWYNEYPHLENSIKKDAVFCFVCSLFHDAPSKEKADPSWISTGVRKWHKMKSVGKNKQGKLAQHFSSQSHKASLAEYCHYLKKTKYTELPFRCSAKGCWESLTLMNEFSKRFFFSSLSRSYSTLLLCSWTTLIEIAVYLTKKSDIVSSGNLKQEIPSQQRMKCSRVNDFKPRKQKILPSVVVFRSRDLRNASSRLYQLSCTVWSD